MYKIIRFYALFGEAKNTVVNNHRARHIVINDSQTT